MAPMTDDVIPLNMHPPTPGWEWCRGSLKPLEHVSGDWYRCPHCKWVGWKQKRPGLTAGHSTPKKETLF